MLIGTCHCGKTGWTLSGDPGRVTTCNCTLCRRYGALWAYDYENERIEITGAPSSYTRAGPDKSFLEILFCPGCAGVLSWRALHTGEDGRRRIAVNLRLAPPEAVADLPIDHFDGLDTFEDLPPRGDCVRDLWA
jgi:hypothetical protein